jgi:hypothetical protein
MLLMTIGSASSQVLNWNFESVKPNNKATNWGLSFTQLLTFDPVTGQAYGDDIVGLDELNFSTTEAFTGNRALEMHNAFNVTQNKVITGGAQIFTNPDSDCPSYIDTGIDLPTGTPVNMLGFYYKYFPQGGDIAQARIEVLGESGGVIGTATVDIIQERTTYHYVYAPVQLTSTEVPTFLRISFTLAKEGTNPTYGTRLIVDNVFVDYYTYNSFLLQTNQNQQNQFSVYPTLVDNELNITKGNTAEEQRYTFSIVNAEGRLIQEETIDFADNATAKINATSFASGIYFIKVTTASGSFTTKFIKK